MKSKESSVSEGQLKMNGIPKWRPALRLGKMEKELSNYLATGAPAVAGPLAHPPALGLTRSKGITVACASFDFPLLGDRISCSCGLVSNSLHSCG